MIKFIFWQIGQWFKPYPDPESWKYRWDTWIYDRKIGYVVEKLSDSEPDVYNLRFPADFTTVIFGEPESLDWPNQESKLVFNNPQAIVAAMEHLETFAHAMRTFGISVEEVSLKIKKLQEVLADDDETELRPIPDDWEPIYIVPGDHNTILGYVDPDGMVHDRRYPIDESNSIDNSDGL
jgi:hypothetical protein